MTIDELHDYCRYLFDESHVHGVPDKDRKAVADWREKHWKDTK